MKAVAIDVATGPLVERDVAGAAGGHASEWPLATLLPGLAIAALLPAFFWPAVIYFTAGLFGVSVSNTVLFSIGAVIAVFLSLVGRAVMQAR